MIKHPAHDIINAILFLLYEKNEFMRPDLISQLLKHMNTDVMDPLGMLRDLQLVEYVRIEGALTNTLKYNLSYKARSEMDFMPKKYKHDPYGYFLSKSERRLSFLEWIRQRVTSTPSKKNKAYNTTSTYEKPLFKHYIWPVLVGLTVLAIAIFLAMKFNLRS